MPQPTSSIAALPDSSGLAPGDLVATGMHIAELGIYGMVWLDHQLVSRSRYGPLVAFIEIDKPVTDSVVALIGLEDDIAALARTEAPVRLLELPAVAMINPDGRAPRLNFTIFWLPAIDRFLLLVYKASSRSDIEVELTRQVRARLIAEAEVQAKSRELSAANEELAIANRDLEQYATIISHDLKAPLRALRYLSDDAEQALRAEEPEKAAAAVTEMRALARRMSRMMSALLDYASVGRKAEAVTIVDTRALAESIAASLPRAPGLRIVIDGDWPEIVTLEAPLDLVLRNLVDNALKHHDRDRGIVRLTARDCGAAIEFQVADDGPGIPAAAHGAIFMPFRTLGGPAGGTGMGLALVSRTVEAVGGTISIHSEPERARGTAFTFKWPKSIA